MLLRLHVMQKVLQLPLFSSLCSSLQQIWMDWWKLLVELCKFLKLDEYGLDVKEKRYVTNIYSYLKFCLWKDDMLCAVEKATMVKVTGHIVFYDANSVLYTVTNIYWKARILLKVILEFCSENCAFFMGTSIHNIWKSTKNKNVETRWKVTEDSRRHKAQTGQKTEILLINTKVWRNRKEKMVFNKRNWFIHSVKVILSAILSDNIAVYDGWIIHQSFLKKLSNQ